MAVYSNAIANVQTYHPLIEPQKDTTSLSVPLTEEGSSRHTINKESQAFVKPNQLQLVCLPKIHSLLISVNKSQISKETLHLQLIISNISMILSN